MPDHAESNLQVCPPARGIAYLPIRNRSNLPAFGGQLSDPEIRSVVAFIKSRWPTGTQAAQAFLNPGRTGMPGDSGEDWRLPPDCKEPARPVGAKR